MTKVGVVIVSYNSSRDLKACISSVLLQDSPQIKCIPIVVDNNSSDNSFAVATKCLAVAIQNATNTGFSKAVNIGVKKAFSLKCDKILILNPDAMLLKGSLAALLNTFNEGGDDVAAVGPMMVHSDKSPANDGYYLKAPSLITVSFFSTLLRPLALKSKFLKNQYEEVLRSDTGAPSSVQQIPGACLLTSKKVLDKIGLLDEDFAIWFEDVEWSYRARKRGYRLLFEPRALVVHEGGVSFSKWVGLEKSVTFYVSMKTFFRKHKPFSYPAVVMVLSLNALISYIKGRDKDQLRFIKRIIFQKKGLLPK